MRRVWGSLPPPQLTATLSVDLHPANYRFSACQVSSLSNYVNIKFGWKKSVQYNILNFLKSRVLLSYKLIFYITILVSQYCQSNCTGGNCLGMSCQATDTCRLTCGQAFCFMTCSAPNCFADCQGGGCDITFVGNSQGTVSCPGGNCRIRCPGPDNCVIKDCGQMNSCTVSYEITPKHLG